MKNMHIYVILHNIRSVYNVGSIFRTADAAGAEKIFLTGYTPAPVDRFGRARIDFAKVSLGAEATVPWESRKNVSILLKELKSRGVFCIAVEQHPYSVDYKKIKLHRDTAFLFGNETEGIATSLVKQCDIIAEIPMRGKKESLNVAVAAGIVLFNALTE